MKPICSALVALLTGLFLTGTAAADGYRLRADAFAATTPPVGFLVLSAHEHESSPYLFDAETMVWTGTGDRPGDAMIASIRVRDPQGRGEVRAGRMLLSTGAVRPLHFDGAAVTAQPPWGPKIEVFGGMPVEPGFGPRSFDWVVGERVSVRVEESAVAGVSYLHRRDQARIAYEEVGLDLAVWPARWLDVSFVSALDLVYQGVSDATLSAAIRGEKLRFELFAARRSPARLLPATSLFAAIGDIPSDKIGTTVSWAAAPRLDVWASAGFESLGGEFGAEQSAHATLRLDDLGRGALGLQLQRQSAPDASWTGLRTTLRWPLSARFTSSTELEVAVPDVPNGRGSIWPWGLLALHYQPPWACETVCQGPPWEAAAAIEALSSPTSKASVAALLRITGRLEGL